MAGISRRFSLLVCAAALAGTLPLAGCGRKGPLDPPPGGYAFEPGTVRTPTTNRGLRREEESQPPPQAYDEQGRPIAPSGQKKKLPGDWLLD